LENFQARSAAEILMATRPRSPTTGRKKTAAPPILNDVVDESAHESAARGTLAGATAGEPAAEVTRTQLEQREIPSFSVSREARIAEAAYWRAERRGFAPGHELDDWLEAERSIDDGEGAREPY
jgi:hypothetical protein